MKRFTLLSMLLGLGLFVIGCSEASKPKTVAPANSTSPTTTPETTTPADTGTPSATTGPAADGDKDNMPAEEPSANGEKAPADADGDTAPKADGETPAEEDNK